MGGLSTNKASGSRYLLAGALAFTTTLTIGNAPYLFFGYGLSAFGMLVAGLILTPTEATAVFLVASAGAVALVALTHSAFTLVIVGAVLVRTFQVYVLSNLKQRSGVAAASASVVLLGTATATALGLLFYGGQATATSATWFDAAFILPAYLLASSISVHKPGSTLLGASSLVLTFGIFLSASPFLVPAAASAGVILLGVTAYIVLNGASKKVSTVLVAVVLVAMPVALASNATALPYNVRNAFYPLYPDSLSSSQWQQTNSSSACMQGDVAGAGTVGNGVWSPSRLRVLDACVTVSGVIEGLSPTSGPANDGDFGIDIKLAPRYDGMLSLGNVVLGGGLMHVEVVPSQQGALAPVLGSLKPGMTIIVTGALVLDTDHGYGSEIHPAWAIAVVPPG